MPVKEIFAMDPNVKNHLPPANPVPGVRYVPSRYTVSFTEGTREYTASTMTKQVLETALPSECFAGQGFDGLIRDRFLVPEGTDECSVYLDLLQALRKEYTSKHMHHPNYVILPTLGCNARCTYCFEEGRPVSSMTDETAGRVIRYITKTHGGMPVRLTWFGGEPLLRPDIIDRVSMGLRKEMIFYHSEFITNASLVTPEITEKMKSLWNTRKVQIAMDGAQEDYVRRKRYVTGSGQYHTVMRAVENIAAAGIRVVIRCNVDRDNLDSVPVFLNDLKQAVLHRGNVTVYCNPLFDFSREDPENNLGLWKRVLETDSLILRAGFSVLNHEVSPNELRLWRCMADQGDVLIAPDGSLFSCDSMPEHTRFGRLGDETEEQRECEICPVPVRQECRDCPFLPECTPFSDCPIRNKPCREVKQLQYLSALRRRLR